MLHAVYFYVIRMAQFPDFIIGIAVILKHILVVIKHGVVHGKHLAFYGKIFVQSGEKLLVGHAVIIVPLVIFFTEITYVVFDDFQVVIISGTEVNTHEFHGIAGLKVTSDIRNGNGINHAGAVGRYFYAVLGLRGSFLCKAAVVKIVVNDHIRFLFQIIRGEVLKIHGTFQNLQTVRSENNQQYNAGNQTYARQP